MHCFYLIISPLKILLKSQTYQYNIIKPFHQDIKDDYVRFEGPKIRIAPIPNGVTHRSLPQIALGHNLMSYCAESESHLSFLETFLEKNTSRRSSKSVSPTETDYNAYSKCIMSINDINSGITQIFMSRIRKNKLPNCTVKFLMKAVSYRYARVYGNYKDYSHQGLARIALLGDVQLSASEILDSLHPLLSVVGEQRVVHLVYVAGFLKLLFSLGRDDEYMISPRLGDPPNRHIHKFLHDFDQHRKVAPKPDLKSALIL
ncbi:putative effector protein [Blumeria hordei DH14]|uniref:Putative effector protein n=1 Tax=Blumeria graminis f. sp. hordei (strain DH14) TaxID=546991 RepID=N1J5X3_BLUG1|nr:putative effector protein [Blumeria hordei DH14]